MERNASDYAYGSVLIQMQEVNSCPGAGVKTQENNSCPGAGVKKTRAHPVAYLSKQFNPSKIYYDIHDKEMLVIARSFYAWETLLKSCQKQITVWTDHKNLEYFNSTKSLT